MMPPFACKWIGRILGGTVVVLAACGNGSEPSETSIPDTGVELPTGTIAPPRTAPLTSPSTITTRGSVTTTTLDTAPDFALELGNGETFVLSEEARPVFMVFWAEW